MRLPRFYPILDTVALQRCNLHPVKAAEALLEAGSRIVQFRHKAQYDRTVYAQARQIASLCRASDALFVVNDRADVAMLLDAALHVGQDDLSPSRARRLIGPNRILGFSTHNNCQISTAAAEPIDYVALGPIFGTASKENPDPVVGLEQLRRLRASIRQPLVAIGGIARENAARVWEAGADSVAVLGDLYPDIRRSAEEWLKLS
jgi:thiamine-phosphate pyrophosphorylase